MSTNFFQRQERARRNTVWLVVLFVTAILAIIAVVYIPIWLFMSAITHPEPRLSDQYPRRAPSTAPYGPDPLLEQPRAPKQGSFAPKATTPFSEKFPPPYPLPHQPADPYREAPRMRIEEAELPPLWNPIAFGISSLLTLSIVGLGSLYKTSQLAGGGKVVALQLGGEPLSPGTRDFREKRLLNVVEEMSIASGVPMPAVYVLRNEPSINAFAAGFTPEDAVIGVSQGCLDYLTRDELQGVVAHEFSHILNGDMRLNIRLMGMIFGLLVLSLVGYYTLYFMSRVRLSGSSDRGKGGGILLIIFLIALAFYILGAVGAFFGRIIQAAVSRQREFLADASAVQFTRNPDGIAGALKKIGGLREGSRIRHPAANEVSHMFFADGLTHWFGSVFATHPPLEVRIRALDPQWDGRYPKVKRIEMEPEPARAAKAAGKPIALPGLPNLPLPVVIGAVDIVDKVGTPTAEATVAAAAFEEQIGPEIREVLADPFTARAVMFAFLLDDNPEVRARQLEALKSQTSPADVETTLHYEQWARSIPLGPRLTMAQLAMPALRLMSKPQYAAFRSTIEALVQADARISFSEFALEQVLKKYLDRAFGLSTARPAPGTIGSVQEAVLCVLGVLAWQGHDDSQAVAKAFADGLKEWHPQAQAALPERQTCSMKRFREALDLLERLRPEAKARLLRAAAAAVGSDGQLTEREYALLRVLCASLDCPLPAIPV